MSVLACDRALCENIMCHRLILGGRMYICNTCFEELLTHKKDWPPRMTALEVRHRIEDFMRSEPGQHIEVDTNEEFDKLANG
jgi:CTP:molybdopterin cytidylyltransferase MocA